MTKMALFSVIKWPCFQLTKTGLSGDRPRLEQPQLISLLENGLLGDRHAIGRYAHYRWPTTKLTCRYEALRNSGRCSGLSGFVVVLQSIVKDLHEL
jgi:hypothetical protein